MAIPRRDVIAGMKFRDLFDRDGLSLAGMIVVMSLFALLIGVVMGNWIIRIAAGPPTDRVEVANQQQAIPDPVREETPVDDRTEPVPDEPDIIDDETGVFVVQVGAFGSRENAERLKADLENRGFSVYITDTQPYRVHLGAYDNREEAEEIRDQVERIGFEAFITH